MPYLGIVTQYRQYLIFYFLKGLFYLRVIWNNNHWMTFS